MDLQAYIDEIKLDVTGGVLELEIDDASLTKIINSAMREIQRYICSTKLLTLPYKECIDLNEYKINKTDNKRLDIEKITLEVNKIMNDFIKQNK